MKTRIYLDNAATTRTSQEVVDAMLPYFTESYGNPSSIYELGQRSKEAITKAERRLLRSSEQKQKRSTLRQAGLKQITGLSRLPMKLIRTREIISLPQRSNITQCFTPASIWKNRERK